MARNTFTSIEFWIKMPLVDFLDWLQMSVEKGEN